MIKDPQNENIDLSSLRIERDSLPSRKRFFRLSTWGIIALVIVLLIIIFASGRFSILSPQISTAKAIILTPSQAAIVLTASGYVAARSKAEISPKSVGRIDWINLEEGQKVKKGELVARLENQELQAEKTKALANLGNAKKELARQKSLFAKGITTEQALDNAEKDLEVFQAQLKNIEELIRNTEIYAPIDGVVTVKKAFLGETVTPQGFGGAGSAGATFAVIVDLSSLEAEVDINEQNLGKLEQGMPADIILDAYPDHPYKARLRQIVPTADRQKGSVKVKVEFLERDKSVLPEMSCRVNFQNPDSLKDIDGRQKVMIPISSVVENDGKKGVFLIDQGKIQFKPVILGYIVGPQVEVKEGLSGGEELVVEAVNLNLKDGQKIRRRSE